jgi:hypothetical protein
VLIKEKGRPVDGGGSDVELQGSPLPDMARSSTWKGGDQEKGIPLREDGLGQVGPVGRERRDGHGERGSWAGRLDRLGFFFFFLIFSFCFYFFSLINSFLKFKGSRF